MELHCKTKRGLIPDLLDKLSGIKSDEEAWLADLFLSNGEIHSEDAARIFSSIIHRLAKDHRISFLFPYDIGEVKRKLRNINVQAIKRKDGLLIKPQASDLPLMNTILKATSFTTFYALVDSEKPEQGNLADIFNDLDSYNFIVVFSIYDDSIEILSHSVDERTIKMAVSGIGAEEGIETIFEGRA